MMPGARQGRVRQEGAVSSAQQTPAEQGNQGAVSNLALLRMCCQHWSPADVKPKQNKGWHTGGWPSTCAEALLWIMGHEAREIVWKMHTGAPCKALISLHENQCCVVGVKWFAEGQRLSGARAPAVLGAALLPLPAGRRERSTRPRGNQKGHWEGNGQYTERGVSGRSRCFRSKVTRKRDENMGTCACTHKRKK